MSSRIGTKSRSLIFIILILSLFFVSIHDTDAKTKRKKSKHRTKRSYNPTKTRAQALDIIRSTSSDISQIAGLVPNLTDSNKTVIKDIILSDEEILSTEGDQGEVIEELDREDDVTVNIENFTTLWDSFMEGDTESPFTSFGIKKSDIMQQIMGWLGTPYRFGGTTRNAIDCSAFTQKIFLSAGDVLLPRVAREQVNYGKKISMKNLQFGDLIFFHTYSKRFASHAGIYLGDHLFAHASSKYGVTVSSLESSYYNRTFIGGRRLTATDMAAFSIKPREALNASKNPSE
jgi:cell wall-associated NlpC family hydrolase